MLTLLSDHRSYSVLLFLVVTLDPALMQLFKKTEGIQISIESRDISWRLAFRIFPCEPHIQRGQSLDEFAHVKSGGPVQNRPLELVNSKGVDI